MQTQRSASHSHWDEAGWIFSSARTHTGMRQAEVAIIFAPALHTYIPASLHTPSITTKLKGVSQDSRNLAQPMA